MCGQANPPHVKKMGSKLPLTNYPFLSRLAQQVWRSTFACRPVRSESGIFRCPLRPPAPRQRATFRPATMTFEVRELSLCLSAYVPGLQAEISDRWHSCSPEHAGKRSGGRPATMPGTDPQLDLWKVVPSLRADLFDINVVVLPPFAVPAKNHSLAVRGKRRVKLASDVGR